jgi:GH24 family phage-related lysozyme (muramidase)
MRVSEHGIDLIKSHEGLRLMAYPDPGTGGEPWTIGYGHTGNVRPGIAISEEQAEDLLREDLMKFEAAVLELLPIELSQSEFDALVSFAFNVGSYALQTSTLRKRLLAGEPRCQVYQEEMPRWNKGANGPMPGLTRRRQEEADLACLGYLAEPVQEVVEPVEEPKAIVFPLDVPYYTQLDSEVWGQAERSCFSSAMAMALEYVDPELMDGDDDWYLREVLKRGDTVSSTAQIETARALGFDVEFHMDGKEQDLLNQLDKGIPVPIGILHKGHVDKPTGGGHWITLIGYDETHFYVNDPMGELSLIGGGYPWETQGRGYGLEYTRKRTLKRWLIDGSGADGWYVSIK